MCERVWVRSLKAVMWNSWRVEGVTDQAYGAPMLDTFVFEGRQRKMPSVSGFHSVGRQCIRAVRGTVFVVIVVQWHLCHTLCDHMDYSMPGLPVPHHLLEFAQVHVHWIGVAIQSSLPLTPFSPSSLGPFQHQILFQWLVCSHQMTKILELQLYVNSDLCLDPHPAAYWLWELR